MEKLYTILLFPVILSCFLFSTKGDNYECLTFFTKDSLCIEAKIWYPIDSNTDIIVVRVNPSLVTSLEPSSSKNTNYGNMLRDKILERGIMFFEFAGRKDSIWKYGQKFPVSTLFTKAEDLEYALSYLAKRKDTHNKKVILLGQSEGGLTTSVVASSKNVAGIILISTPGTNGKTTTDYQQLYKDSLFMETFGLDPEFYENINKISSVSKQKYKRSYEGYHQFKEDMLNPLKTILFKYDNYDTIAYNVLNYLREKWSLEDSITRKSHRNFQNYCASHEYKAFIQPQQIALKKWIPELYFPKIKCPVLAVFGSLDRNLEYVSSLENIEKMLYNGGNMNFTPIVLEGYDHMLQNNKKQIETDSINKIIDWILKLKK